MVYGEKTVFFSDPGVHFIWGLSDVDAIIHETAELTCKLSSDDYEGAWFRDGKKVGPRSHTSQIFLFSLTECENMKNSIHIMV